MSEPVTLKIDGQRYSGWTKVRIDRSLKDVAGAFNLSLTRKWDDANAMVIKDGSACQVLIGDEVVLTGYVDDFMPSYDAESVAWEVSGRSKTGDLVDSSAVYKAGSWSSVTLDRVARDICAPFGINVVVECDMGDKFAKVSIEQGEAAFELLDRLAKQRGILLTTNALGDLVLTQASEKTLGAQVHLTLGQNILAARGQFSQKERASQWIVKGSSYGGGAEWDAVDSKSLGGQQAVVTDAEVSRYRPRIIIAEDVTTAAGASRRGQWQKQRSQGEGTQTEITVPGWRALGEQGDQGPLWSNNRLVPIKDEIQGINASWLSVNVSFSEDDQGRITVLTFMPREAMLIPPEEQQKAKGKAKAKTEATW